ncbi:hypothetical protein [Myroides sp. WP-1]|uniref:hypothetical protein n=1 Tax=Myroides sp. WP-1 TaxID=2759944 RepID=UPI0015FDF720|nr:hypothetical protein [Myroides sp. WP-1]MBB1140697.1 hypothetical protein [Myroides sp. WP-1]
MKKKIFGILLIASLLFLTWLINDKWSINNSAKNNLFLNEICKNTDFSTVNRYESLIIIVMKKDYLYLCKLRQIYSVYERDYARKISYCDFLYQVQYDDLLPNFLINEISFNQRVKIDLNIKQEYNENGLDFIKRKYCVEIKKDKEYILNQKMQFNESRIFTLMYYFFCNGFYNSIGSQDGEVLFFKIK